MNFKVEHSSLKLEVKFRSQLRRFSARLLNITEVPSFVLPLQPVFRVMGFSVTGRVLNGGGGEGVPEAAVSLNNLIRGRNPGALLETAMSVSFAERRLLFPSAQ